MPKKQTDTWSSTVKPVPDGHGYHAHLEKGDEERCSSQFRERGTFESMSKAKAFGAKWAAALDRRDALEALTMRERRDALPGRLVDIGRESAKLEKQKKALSAELKSLDQRQDSLIGEANRVYVDVKLLGDSEFSVTLAPNVSDGTRTPGGEVLSSPAQTEIPLTQLEAAEKRHKKLTADLETMNRILENPDSTPDQCKKANKEIPKLEREAAKVFETIVELRKKTGKTGEE